jgi:hypothetical protein
MNRTAFGLLLASCLPAGADAGGLGRMFFTPEQRRQLDARPDRRTAAGEELATGLMLNGIVQTADGTRTIWINGKAQVEDGNGRAPDVQLVSTPGNPQPVPVRVGQRLLPDPAAEE